MQSSIAKKKQKKKGKRTNRTQVADQIIRVRLPKKEDGEVLGQVIQTLGGGLLLVRCLDGHTRQINIPGKYRKRMWVRLGDVIRIIPQFGLDEKGKGTLEHRYRKNGAQILYNRGLIPEEYII